VFYWEIEDYDDIDISCQLQLLFGFHYYNNVGIGIICDIFLVNETRQLAV